MPLLVVTQCQALGEEERKLHEKPGKHMKTSLQYLCFSCLPKCRNHRELVAFIRMICCVVVVMRSMSMKPERSSLLAKVEQ